MARAYIGLGSNLGDRRMALAGAIEALARHPDIRVLDRSPLVESAPLGPEAQPDYLNGVVSLETRLEPLRLLETLAGVEVAGGRTRGARWGPRTLDLDLLLYEDRIISTPDLQVPHPGLRDRRFVLGPLAAIAPEAVDPVTGHTIRTLLEDLDRRDAAAGRRPCPS